MTLFRAVAKERSSDAFELDQLCINTIRALAMDAVERAGSGPMGVAPMAYVLWTRVLRHHPRNPAWPDRDRFVLSAGHASLLLYALLHLTGYHVSLEDLTRFRQWGSGPRATRNTASRRVSRPLPAPSRRALATPWVWRSPSRSWPADSTAPRSTSSTTTPTPSARTET